MSIRFDKDTRRATNGPMIFFSDPSAETAIGEEIRSAIKSRLSVYAYRHPEEMMITFGSAESIFEGIGCPGFIIAPFYPNYPYLTIPFKPETSTNRLSSTPSSKITTIYSKPTTTTRQQYEKEVNAIREALSEEGYGKVVAARAIAGHNSIDPGTTFTTLCRKYPNAFVFCFYTPYTGCWVGASPELLLEAYGGSLQTMSLAGTRKCFSSGNWDDKNIEEQIMVTDFITEVLRKNSLIPLLGNTFTKQAGIVEHICTPICADINTSGFDTERLTRLLRDLSPTPALCGLPRTLALSLILKYENFSRGCYGGFCGPFHNCTDFSFFVNLRSALIERDSFCIFAGGGITSKSNVDLEWQETELKAQTILSSIEAEP